MAITVPYFSLFFGTAMDEWLDIAWDHIMDLFAAIAAMIDRVLAPLNHHFGPALTILIIVVLLVAVTKLLNNVYTTKRHVALKANYEHWFDLRREAMACDDREKGKALARNIDQAKLNKAYYDYFFEGFLKSILTSILPILFAAAYVNRAYAPDQLMKRLGREYIFNFSRSGGEPVIISSFFWFIICLFFVHLTWFLVSLSVKKQTRKKEANRVQA